MRETTGTLYIFTASGLLFAGRAWPMRTGKEYFPIFIIIGTGVSNSGKGDAISTVSTAACDGSNAAAKSFQDLYEAPESGLQ